MSSTSSSSSSRSSLSCGRLATWTIAAGLLQLLGLSLFVIGFFPAKPTLSGISGPDSFRTPTCDSSKDLNRTTPHPDPDQLQSLYKDLSQVPPSFDRLILMVVDGLPAQFVLGKGDEPPTKSMAEAMPYTQSLLSNGGAVGYHAKAAPPTVTMPRLKAMVSGAIGGFLDVAFNFNTQAFLDDSLIAQFYNIGWKMVMLGDETWIKLFPGLFTRQDGVSSFYVKDTVEVDHNVSRHLDVELITSDWNLLVLHYLGLDHVGHIGGRHCDLMPPKLKEMDDVIKKIHMSIVSHQNNLDKRTLLMVVSDHGMTESGNHGGSSYEETDSLALFIGLDSSFPSYALAHHNTVFQVDIAATLALLFGVPIPKNNVGVLIPGTLASLTDGQLLRALELNSWQILRLLGAQLPGLLCGNSPCSRSGDGNLEISKCDGSLGAKLCGLFSKAVAFHDSWKAKTSSSLILTNSDAFQGAVAAYYEFLRTATEWLSRSVTEKPLNLLTAGIAIIVISCLMLLSLLFRLCREACVKQALCFSGLGSCRYNWHLDESFVWAAVLAHVLSLGSSSMKSGAFSWSCITRSDDNGSLQGKNRDTRIQICSILMVLVCGRILRGWHQGGVNWTHLPDISKFLEDAGAITIKLLQIASVLLIISFVSFAIYVVKPTRILVLVVQFSICISGLLVILYILEYQSTRTIVTNYSATKVAQLLFAVLGVTVMGTAWASPWIMPVPNRKTCKDTEPNSTTLYVGMEVESLVLGASDSAYLIGMTYVVCWCLLQLLLQQPINAVPILLLLLQILSSMICFSTDSYLRKQWVEAAAMYFLGMAGHFGLGNSNGLATVDVAGAFIGISSHSTVLAGILMFMITYASPLLFLLGMTMYIPIKAMKCLPTLQNADFGCHLRMMIGIPCLLPLGLNSISLAAYTIILLLMRNHLFIWSVFSPKYLYVCAATVSVYLGVSVVAATGVYTCSVFIFRTKAYSSKGKTFVESPMATEMSNK
ncbi:hypothetical protein MRB53_015239 [Persea americana]|uniref:Uncharacterized protein n=1 Tax=Persea americana TaxID=3435 RepID=A0ACC2KDB1_PERAE|nr:hypothetical protein MRB53_015239 [Persea americana]